MHNSYVNLIPWMRIMGLKSKEMNKIKNQEKNSLFSPFIERVPHLVLFFFDKNHYSLCKIGFRKKIPNEVEEIGPQVQRQKGA